MALLYPVAFCHGFFFFLKHDCVSPLPDGKNVYPVTEQYGAQNGYTVQVLPLQGLVELRASYFSPHTENKVRKNLMI